MAGGGMDGRLFLSVERERVGKRSLRWNKKLLPLGPLSLSFTV